MVHFKFEFKFSIGKRHNLPKAQTPVAGWDYVNSEVERAKMAGKFKTASNYLTAARSWTKFMGATDWTFADFTAERLRQYQHWLGEHNVCQNTSSAYMRSLRAMYNRTMECKNMSPQKDPFANIYTGRAKTAKRSITHTDIMQLFALQLDSKNTLALARDIFVFSFCAMGMPFVDVAYLKKGQIKGQYIQYTRHKTGQRIQVALLPIMEEIINRYATLNSDFVFPILDNDTEPSSSFPSVTTCREQLHRLYLRRLRQYNYSLKQLSEMLGGTIHLSSYVVRHSWASIAYQHHLDIEMIGKAMGHTKTSTTLLYIKNLCSPDLAAANQSLMEELGL